MINSRSAKPLDFALLFVKSEKDLKKRFSEYAARLKPEGMLWVAWPKKSSAQQPIFLLLTFRQSVSMRDWSIRRFAL